VPVHHVLYYTDLDVVLGQNMWTLVACTRNWRALGPAPLKWERVSDPIKHAVTKMDYHTEFFFVIGQTVCALVGFQNFWVRWGPSPQYEGRIDL